MDVEKIETVDFYIKGIIKFVEEEYNEFIVEQLQKSKEELLENGLEIFFYNEIKECIVTDKYCSGYFKENFTIKQIKELYEKGKGLIYELFAFDDTLGLPSKIIGQINDLLEIYMEEEFPVTDGDEYCDDEYDEDE